MINKERQSINLLCNDNYPSRVAFELEQAPVACHAFRFAWYAFLCFFVNTKQRKLTLNGREQAPFPQYVALDFRKTTKLFPRLSTAMIPVVGQMLLCSRTGRE